MARLFFFLICFCRLFGSIQEETAAAPPKVSVICPTYNRPERHANLYKAFVQQTYENKELLILDDSPEPSPFFMHLNDPRVKYHHVSQRVSIGAKRNTLIGMALGEIIAHFDDDDYYAPAYLSTMVNNLGTHDLVKLSKWLAWRETDGSFWEWDSRFVGPMHFLVLANEERILLTDLKKIAADDRTFELQDWTNANIWGFGFSYVYKKSLGKECPFEDINGGEDYRFISAAQKRGKNLIHVPDHRHIAVHTLHPKSTSRIFPQYKHESALTREMLGEEALSWLIKQERAQEGPKNIGIITHFKVPEKWVVKVREANYNIQYFDHRTNAANYLSAPLKKIILMNRVVDPAILAQIPKEKLILFVWEAWPIEPSYYDYFSKVYTYNDDLVDGKKFFKLYYPDLSLMLKGLPSFEEKRLCTLICSNICANRAQVLDFFETKPAEQFDFFGHNTSNKYKSYRGEIPGDPSSHEKLNILKNYRFSICFENTTNVSGYITEKIFHCFTAGCVPVYFGAPNIEKLIPKDCFIDYRQFSSNEEMLQFLKNMPKATYEQYLQRIQAFLASEQAQVSSLPHLHNIFLSSLKDW